MNFDEMPAGRELDALVAEKVMNLQNVHRGAQGGCAGGPGQGYTQCVDEFYYHCPGYFSKEVPHYSTDIAAAWQVVLMVKQVHKVCFGLEDYQLDGKYWQAMFKGGLDNNAGKWTRLDCAFADTPELAICRAALKVVTE